MADVSDFDERMRDGHFEAKWSGRPKVVIAPPAPPPAPPTPPETSIGSVTITGPTSVTEGETEGYVASTPDQSRDAVLEWNWSVDGGTILSEDFGSCSVQWGSAGSGSVSVTIIDSAPGATDSPQSSTVNVIIAAPEPEPEPEENEDDL